MGQLSSKRQSAIVCRRAILSRALSDARTLSFYWLESPVLCAAGYGPHREGCLRKTKAGIIQNPGKGSEKFRLIPLRESRMFLHSARCRGAYFKKWCLPY
jgi:hypothetical protein